MNRFLKGLIAFTIEHKYNYITAIFYAHKSKEVLNTPSHTWNCDR
jgi:hypothetical protein